MVDNDQNNEEYQFSDLEALNPEYNQANEESMDYESPITTEEGSNNRFWRNIIITVSVVVLAMLAYKFLGSRWGTDKPAATVPATTPVQEPKFEQPVIPKPVEKPASKPEKASEPESDAIKTIKKKVGQIALSQQNISSEMNITSNQLNEVNSSIDGLKKQIEQLNNTISQLNQELSQQSNELAALKMRLRPKPVSRPAAARVVRKPVVYNIQALIPGRAWLIASNGSTITVSEGSSVPGYGSVKLIDPVQGLILTSSGRMIRFSQQDN